MASSFSIPHPFISARSAVPWRPKAEAAGVYDGQVSVSVRPGRRSAREHRRTRGTTPVHARTSNWSPALHFALAPRGVPAGTSMRGDRSPEVQGMCMSHGLIHDAGSSGQRRSSRTHAHRMPQRHRDLIGHKAHDFTPSSEGGAHHFGLSLCEKRLEAKRGAGLPRRHCQQASSDDARSLRCAGASRLTRAIRGAHDPGRERPILQWEAPAHSMRVRAEGARVQSRQTPAVRRQRTPRQVSTATVAIATLLSTHRVRDRALWATSL